MSYFLVHVQLHGNPFSSLSSQIENRRLEGYLHMKTSSVHKLSIRQSISKFLKMQNSNVKRKFQKRKLHWAVKHPIMWRLEVNPWNKRVNQKVLRSHHALLPCEDAASAQRSWWVSVRQVNRRGKAGVSLPVTSTTVPMCVCDRGSECVHVYMCTLPPPQEGVSNTTWDFVRHLQPGLFDLVCVAASLIGQTPLHCQCVFYTELCIEASGSDYLLSLLLFTSF